MKSEFEILALVRRFRNSNSARWTLTSIIASGLLSSMVAACAPTTAAYPESTPEPIRGTAAVAGRTPDLSPQANTPTAMLALPASPKPSPESSPNASAPFGSSRAEAQRRVSVPTPLPEQNIHVLPVPTGSPSLFFE